jgi:hypothetical protein
MLIGEAQKCPLGAIKETSCLVMTRLSGQILDEMMPPHG